MQGKLQEIDIRSVFQLIEFKQQTGTLFVEASTSHYWYVFFLKGRILYASETEGSTTRLRGYLKHFQADSALERVPAPAPGPATRIQAPEYARLVAILQQRLLAPAQGQQVIANMIREVMFDLLHLQQGSFIFDEGAPLEPQVVAVPVAALLAETTAKLREWQQLHPYVQSPEQCPTLVNPADLQRALPPQAFEAFSSWSDGNTPIRQIGRYLGRDVLTAGKALYPYIKQGAIQLTEPPALGLGQLEVPSSGDRAPHIVCIDDSIAIQKTVEYILQGAGYQVTTIGNPLKALGQVFLLNPAMILCDIAMPKLDGYELCAMLRKSVAFQQTPIVMLTGKDGFTERIRARMAGASEFLTKPFGEKELLAVIESSIGAATPEEELADPVAADVS